MTKPEFTGPYQRLCTRFKLEPSDEQARIWYLRFGQRYGLPVWDAAVDSLVAEMRSPLAEHVFKAVDAAAEHFRRTQTAQDRRSAAGALDRLYRPDGQKPAALDAVFASMRDRLCGINEAVDAVLPKWIATHPEDTDALESWQRIQAQRKQEVANVQTR